MYFMPDLLDGYDSAINLSYHSGDSASDNVEFQIENIAIAGAKADTASTEITMELIISSRTPILKNGLKWYAGAGVHRIENDVKITSPNGQTLVIDNQPLDISVSDTEFSIVSGVVLPTSFGHVYAAAEHIDDNLFGIGLRYNIR